MIFRPFIPLRVTLSSGDVIELRDPDSLTIIGLSLAVDETRVAAVRRLRLVSLPNIAMIEPIAGGEREL